MAETAATPSAAARWGQLSYASFDAGAGRGGWQVKETSGALTREEREELVARVVTNFNSHQTLSQFPTVAEQNALPRRFSYVPSAGGAAAYFHAAEAGSDRTGRPGNVFSHIVLDRLPASTAVPLRPIELWRSPDLLVPFGADSVLSATFSTPDVPRTGDAISRESVLNFVLDDSTWRVGLLCVLMDAVAASLEGGPNIVLITETPDRAALWIGAVSYLMSPGTSRRLGWSLYERSTGLAALWARGISVVGVPREDAHLVIANSNIVVIDDTETPGLGAFGASPHTTAAASTVLVTEWSEMAQMVLVDREIALRVLEGIDQIAHEVGDHDLMVAWPLAMSVLSVGADAEDAGVQARRVVESGCPVSIENHPEFLKIVGNAVERSIGTTTQDAFTRWKDIDRHNSPIPYKLMVLPYLTRALGDREWLSQSGGVPLPVFSPTETRSDLKLKSAGEDALAAALDSDDSSVQGAVLSLRLVELLVSVGLITANGDQDNDSIRQRALDLLLKAPWIHLRNRDSGPVVVGLSGTISTVLAEILLEQVLNQGSLPERGRDGHPRLHADEVISWLCNGTVTNRLAQDLRDPNRAVAPLELDIALWLHEHGSTAAGLTPLIVRGLLAWYGRWSQIPSPPVPTPTDVWRLSDLLHVERNSPGQLPDAFFASALASLPWSADLAELCNYLDHRPPHRSPARDYARLRMDCAASATNATVVSRRQLSRADVQGFTVRLFLDTGSALNWEEIAPLFLTEQIASALEHGWNVTTEGPTARTITAAGESANLQPVALRLERFVNTSRSSKSLVAEFAGLAVMTAMDFPVTNPALVTDSANALCSITYLHGGSRVRLIEAPVRYAIQHWNDEELRSLETCTLTLVTEAIETRVDSKRASKIVSDAERFAAKWWLTMGRPTPVSSKTSLKDKFLRADRKDH